MVDALGNWYPDFMGQQPWQDPQYRARVAATAPAGVMAKKIDLIQIGNEQEVGNYPAGAMLMTKDDKTIIIKNTNGVTYYDMRPPAPPEKPFDPNEFVRRDEIDQMIAEALKGGAK